jgi:hypothetical protein
VVLADARKAWSNPRVGQIKAKGHANRFHRGRRSAVRSEWRLLADHLTRATGGELLLDRRRDHSDAQLLQPPDLGGGERLVRDIIEHRPARTAPSHAGVSKAALCAASSGGGKRFSFV